MGTTTHKSLQGPRAGMIFAKMNGKVENIAQKIDEAVFPALQGGPHNHQIGGLAVQLKAVCSPDFKDYAKQVVANSQALAKELQKLGHKLSSDGTPLVRGTDVPSSSQQRETLGGAKTFFNGIPDATFGSHLKIPSVE